MTFINYSLWHIIAHIYLLWVSKKLKNYIFYTSIIDKKLSMKSLFLFPHFVLICLANCCNNKTGTALPTCIHLKNCIFSFVYLLMVQIIVLYKFHWNVWNNFQSGSQSILHLWAKTEWIVRIKCKQFFFYTSPNILSCFCMLF